MITRPEDYRFVDFAAGDMPTDLFNGEIFPLRSSPKALKGEDIAFAYEAAAARLTALDGAEIYDISVGSFVAYQAPEVARLIPTKVISSEQMKNVVARVVEAKDIGGYFSPLSYLGESFEEMYDDTIVSVYEFEQIHVIPKFTCSKSMPIPSISSGRPVKSLDLEQIYDCLAYVKKPLLHGDVGDRYTDVTLVKSAGDSYPFAGDDGLGLGVFQANIERNEDTGEIESQGVSYYVGPRRRVLSIPNTATVRHVWMAVEVIRADSRPHTGVALIEATGLFDISGRGSLMDYYLTPTASERIMSRAYAVAGLPFPQDPKAYTYYQHKLHRSMSAIIYVECELDDRTTW